MESLRGIVPIVVTTFHEDGSLDLESQRRLIRHLLDQGVHGLALFGNASEGYTLTNSEREELLGITLKEVKGSVPVIASTGHNGTHAAVELSRAAEKAGADALMVLPPFTSNRTGRESTTISPPFRRLSAFPSWCRMRLS